MTELSKSFSKPTLNLTLLLVVLLLFLVACGKTTSKPEISLSADKTTLTNGGDVTLRARVKKGRVTSVTFETDKGAPLLVTTPDAAGEFVTTVNVTETTVFTAEATGPDGTSASTSATSVTVTVKIIANAPAQTFKTYRNVPYLSGVTPVKLSATSQTVVTGIVGDVVAEKIATAAGGTVEIMAGKNALAFSYEPKTDFLGNDTFSYKVRGSDAELKTGIITVQVANLPTDVFVLSTFDDFGATTINQTVLLNKMVLCSTNPCVTLREGQTLAGNVVTAEGITLSSPTAGILADIPGTRQPGTAGGSGVETRVIELADNSSVKDLTIDGAGERYFVAIRGNSYEGSSVLEGNISIKDVLIKNSNGKPIYFKCADFPCSQTTDYGAYDLTIENLRVENAFDTLVIGAPGRLVFKNSSVDLRQPTVNSQSFGDNVGIDVEDLLGASLEFNNVDVYMQSPKNKLDNNAINYGAIPFVITNRAPATTTTLVFSNNDITFGDPDSNWSLSSVRTIRLSALNGAEIEIENSTNNTSEATGNDVDRNPAVSGQLGGLE